MDIIWNNLAQCYWFDTGLIFGGIEPYTNYHGINGLMHHSERINIVNISNAFLNAEYYLRPGSGLEMLPRKISLEKRTSHQLCEDTVTIHFSSEPKFGFEIELAYRPHDDAVDMQMTISPTKDIAKFEIFFASYVCQAFDETWVPLKNTDGTEEWVKLNNREVINECFGIVRDEEIFEIIKDGRYNNYKGKSPLNEKIEDRLFSKPILVARNSRTGFGLIFLLDPAMTTYLAGQYHGWDTAHDWCFGADLVKGRQFTAHARMIYRPFDNLERMFTEVSDLWSE